MRLVVIGEDVTAPVACRRSAVRIGGGTCSFSFSHNGHGLAEGAIAGGRHGQIGFQQPLELRDRLVVEADVVEFAGVDARLGEAVFDGLLREVLDRASCA